ncbi:MAG: glycosyltransferase [Candidatus Saccharibacteria bacterium]|nr:glycosyltransferase [Candidatus Saccharibacteria bacterium]
MTLQVSVIVAVYQAEKFINRCLDSLLKQSLRNVEFILVDDGSTDNSGKICDEYANLDSRFRVIHKKNGGVSSARQAGLDMSNGEYTIHVDPDDWVDPDMLKDLYNFAIQNGSDVVVCDYFRELNDKSDYIQQKPTSLNSRQYFYDLIHNLHGSCWNKLVRRSCFKNFDIRFPTNMIMWEDKYVNLKLASNPISVSYFPRAYYHYDESNNVGGAVRSWSKKKLKSQMYLIDWLDSIDNPEIIKRVTDLKLAAKKTAFFAKDVSAKEFRTIYPEINYLYRFDVCQVGHLPFLLFIATKYSLTFARILQVIKIKLLGRIQ